MREIKFRAWHIKEKILLKVDRLTFVDNCDECGKGILDEHNDWHSLRDIKLMQFTGLKDKNGKEIYEGDVIRYGDGGVEERFQIRLVYFKDGSFLVDDDVYFNGDLSPIIISNFTEEDNECEVIGNIYENSEVLDAEQSTGEGK